ncbi:MAG: nifR3 family TIM-barrel protein [Bacillota bacterium]|nr:MAG: nifR3 family TIM-barrel protein [Bacillota bacterium]
MRIGNIQLDVPLIAAPMAGITDQAYRLLAREFGAAYVVSEMVSCKGLMYDQAKTWELLVMDEREQPLAIQLFGCVPHEIAKAAAVVEERTKARAIDINMGCPTPKIVKCGEGAALMLEPQLVENIVRAVVAAVSIPVTVKTRKAWDATSPTAVDIAKRVEAAGASAITVHGRTREQFYAGKADWDIIRQVKQAVSIPVIGNGDVFCAADAHRMMQETGCDAIMTGRGTLGNPWLFRDIARSFWGLPPLAAPDVEERIVLAKRHLQMAIERKGLYTGIREMRPHLAWYTKGLPRAARLREAINRADTTEKIDQIFEDILQGV